jgi:hypothetical protein
VLYETTLFGAGATPANRSHVVCSNDTAVLATADLATQIPNLKLAALTTASSDHPPAAPGTATLITALHLASYKKSP